MEAIDPGRQAEPERLRRVIQRPVPQRVPQGTLVHPRTARPHSHRDVTAGIQQQVTQGGTRRAHPRRLCRAAGVHYEQLRTLDRPATER